MTDSPREGQLRFVKREIPFYSGVAQMVRILQVANWDYDLGETVWSDVPCIWDEED
jgi:hypothetical protein